MTEYIATIQMKVLVSTHHMKNVKKIISDRVPYRHAIGTEFGGFEMRTDKQVVVLDVVKK